MEAKSYVNKDSFKLLILQNLKSQIRSQLGDTISKNLQKHMSSSTSDSDSVVNAISSNISHSSGFSELKTAFISDVESLLADTGYHPEAQSSTSITLHEATGLESLNSSTTSLNTSSIDFLSSDQFQNLAQRLSNGTSLEKLEALETFSRLPTLEHIMKPTLWPLIENGLTGIMSCDISFLRESGLKLYTKMLSSSEPKVVQESYASLLKYLLRNVEILSDSSNDESKYLCQVTVELIVTLNKFLQSIPIHWLRYPQAVIEDIIINSINILTIASKDMYFPVWTCIALCDPESRWIRNIINGHTSRSFVLQSLSKDAFLLKFAIDLCKSFYEEECSNVDEKKCCDNISHVSKITHVICFLSHFLQYSDGRSVFQNVIEDDCVISWISVLDLIMQSSIKLCRTSCLDCSKIVCDAVSYLWNCFEYTDEIATVYDIIQKALTSCFEDLKNSDHETNDIYFMIQCLCQAFNHFCVLSHISKLTISGDNVLFLLLKHCFEQIDFSNVSGISSSNIAFLIASLSLVKKLIFFPNLLLLESEFIELVSQWWLRVNHVCLPMLKTTSSSHQQFCKIDTKLMRGIEEKFSDVHIFFLSKPSCLAISHVTELFEVSVDVLLDKIMNNIETKNSVCPLHTSVLSSALSFDMTFKQVLNKSNVLKLSSVIWHLTNAYDYVENMDSVKAMLYVLVPHIFTELVKTQILADVYFTSEDKLMEYTLLFPDITKCEYFTTEDSRILGLQILSLLANSVQTLSTLESSFKISNLFLENLANMPVLGNRCIIDETTVLQNHILVKLYAIGGPNERVVPPETLSKLDESYDWPIVEKYPVDDKYYKIVHHAPEVDTELNVEDKNLQDIYMEIIKSCKRLTLNAVSWLLKESTSNMTTLSSLSKFLNSTKLDEAYDIILHDETRTGISMTIRYGKTLNILKDESHYNLEQLIKASKYLLGTENSSRFDTFLSTIFMMCNSDSEISWRCLEKFAESINSTFIWYEWLIQLTNNKLYTCHTAIMEYCDIIIKETMPAIFSAFHRSGILPSVMFNYWTMLCYWNYLDWNEICHFVLQTVLFSGDYAIYFFASVLKHLKHIIFEHAHSHDILYILKRDAISGYNINDHIDFIKELANKYHENIFTLIGNTLK